MNNSSTPYTYKPKTAEPAASFYKPPPPSHSSSFYKPPPPPKSPKLDINDAVAFPSLMATMPPRASMRTASKESIAPPKPKLNAWTAVAAKPAEAKPAEVKPAEEASVGIISGRRNAFDNTPRSLSAIGTRCFDDGPEDYDGPDEEEEGEGEGEGEFNAHLTLDRRRGEKIL